MVFEKSKNFIYKNARPLDFARWLYLFENGSKEDVLSALETYQNNDGGFGHALEPDCWNPNSSPIQTWVATRIIDEIDLEQKSHHVIQGILKYLASGADFDGHTWSNTIASNNDFPCAPWWIFDPEQETTYNPTASLIGFILKFTERGSEFYKRGVILAKEAYAHFKSHQPLEQMHTIACYVDLYEYLKESSIYDVLDMQEFKALLSEQIQYLIASDTSKWAIDYACKPSLFVRSKNSDFYLDNKEICDYECEFISTTQESDGTWSITWSWADYPEQWHISKNWWKADLLIRNLRYIKSMCQ